MKNYEPMVERIRQLSREKKELACRTIKAMEKEGSFISVNALSKRTGISRSYFYQNEEIKEILKDVKRRQIGMVYAREETGVINQAILMQVHQLKKEIGRLKKENDDLKSAIIETHWDN